MKIKYLIFILFISLNIYSQDKVIVPKKGEIAFVKEEKIIDKDAFQKSLLDLKPKIKKALESQIILERSVDDKAIDTTLLKSISDEMFQSFEMLLPMLFSENNEPIKYFLEFKGDTLISYISLSNNEIRDKVFINQSTLLITNENKITIDIPENEIINLIEYKNELKIINGFNCFKVIYTYLNSSDDSEFDLFNSLFINKRELWVTEAIKCNFHPVVHEKNILKNYYPLEIIETTEEVKGVMTIYNLINLNLN